MTRNRVPGWRWANALPRILVLALGLSGCGGRAKPSTAAAVPPRPAASASGFPLSLEDDSGRTVRLEREPERIVSLAPAHTETLYALGLGDRIVAADTYSDYPAEAKHKALLNCWPKPPTEQIVGLKPDLIVVFTQGDDFLREMDALRIPTVKIFPRSYDEAVEGIRTLGRITGAGAKSAALVAEMRARVGAIEQKLQGVKPRKVMLELDAVDPARPFVAGGDGVYGDLLHRAGGENIFHDLRLPAAQVSAEQVISRNPEVILLGDTKAPVQPQQPELVRARPGWDQVAAVKQGQVYKVYSERITRPGLRLAEGLEEIARLLHPDRF